MIVMIRLVQGSRLDFFDPLASQSQKSVSSRVIVTPLMIVISCKGSMTNHRPWKMKKFGFKIILRELISRVTFDFDNVLSLLSELLSQKETTVID